MNSTTTNNRVSTSNGLVRPLWTALNWVCWPLVFVWRALYKHFIAYILSTVLRDRDRVYSVKFVWYGESVYLHPMIWGSLLLYVAAMTGWIPAGWLLLAWFLGLTICYLTIMYDFDVIKSATLGIGVVATLGLAYFATVEFAWNPLYALGRHITSLEAGVTPGFYQASAYIFTGLIFSEVIWSWLFHRVELDESYVYEHAFLRGVSREPIFARGLRRESRDLLEVILLGAGDIEHRTKKGFKRFKNVPFASLWLGTAIDSLLDHRRRSEVDLQTSHDESDQAMVEHAMQDIDEGPDDAGDGADDGGDDGGDDGDF